MNRRLAQGYTPDADSSGEGRAKGSAGVHAVVALGANLGAREATLQAAAEALRALPLTDDVRVAEPVSSVAVKLDGPDASAPAYLNTVAVMTTRLAPSVLLDRLHEIENAHGRVRLERWGDRTLDLDIVAYGDVRSDDPLLTLPHPRAAERSFVLDPWLAVDPEAVLPGVGRVADLAAALTEGAVPASSPATPVDSEGRT